MRSKLEEKERKHFLKTKSTNFEGAQVLLPCAGCTCLQPCAGLGGR